MPPPQLRSCSPTACFLVSRSWRPLSCGQLTNSSLADETGTARREPSAGTGLQDDCSRERLRLLSSERQTIALAGCSWNTESPGPRAAPTHPPFAGARPSRAGKQASANARYVVPQGQSEIWLIPHNVKDAGPEPAVKVMVPREQCSLSTFGSGPGVGVSTK